ncbi:hypothetical protein MMEU_2045 [Mycobacterium marinum str. Europe]|nr:hypothetical protein MMEU_2045 [Mycobacterium marinum str. Europe]
MRARQVSGHAAGIAGVPVGPVHAVGARTSGARTPGRSGVTPLPAQATSSAGAPGGVAASATGGA